tara:strand:- start:2747 stop:2947 length:201 start_codon:yes stop_codon:yes gene_type:complete
MNTSFKSIDELLEHVTDNTDEIIDSIAENDIETVEELEEFLRYMVQIGLLKIIGQDKDGNDLYEAL